MKHNNWFVISPSFFISHALTSQFVAHNSKKLIEGHNKKQNAWTSSCAKVFKKLCEKYDDVSSVDALARVNEQVNVVKLQMTENIAKSLEQTVSLEHISSNTGIYIYIVCMYIQASNDSVN